MKYREMFFYACLICVAMVAAWEMDLTAHAQSHSNIEKKPEQGGAAITETNDPASDLETQKDQVNYAIGVNLIGNLKKQGVDIDLEMVIRGMRDAFSGDSLLLSDDALQRTIMQYHSGLRRMQAKVKTATAEDNKKEGEAFLSANSKKEGVVTLTSGLQYRIMKAGNGKKPTDTDTVECHYRGTFINGNEFDSSYRTGKPATFKINGVISGWKEALLLMPAGSTWQIFVPPELAYGERGAVSTIGPNATLVFEIELLAIK